MNFFNVEHEIKKIKNELHNSFDVVDRVLQKGNIIVGFIYLKSFTDNLIFSTAIYEPVSSFDKQLDFDNIKNLVQANDTKEIKKEEIVENILKGAVVILTNTSQKILSVDIQKFNARAPSEPPTTPVIQGPREGFTEDIKTNIGLLRKRFYSPDLVLKNLSVGRRTKTQIIIAYLDNVADKKTVKEIEKKLKKIDIDGVVDSYYLIPFLAERPNSLFKQIGNTEKPDIVCAKLLEGRVAIMVDNTPMVLTVPFVLLEDLQNTNDYYTNYIYSTLLRFVRLIGSLFAILGPGIYIALQLFHYNVLPLKYLITIADSTQQIPFTPFIEILFISLLFQILYEVSLRLPSYLGLATSIVGALILGDTGVKAGLISPPAVIVVAIAKIALYTIPEQSAQITVLQFIFLLIGASVGLFGIIGGAIYFVGYLNSIENFKTPYLAPFSPFILKDNKDGIIRVPITTMEERPFSFSTPNKRRIGKWEMKA